MSCPHEWVGANDTYYPCQLETDHYGLHTHDTDHWAVEWATGSEFNHVDQVEDDPPMPPVTTRYGVTT